MQEIDFAEDHLANSEPSYMWGDNPFVVSVLCKDHQEGFLTEWWVTGRRFSETPPRLVLRMRLSLSSTKDELRERLLSVWFEHLADLSFDSASSGGVENPSSGLKELHPDKQQQLFQFHLSGHDQFRHFNIAGNSKVEKTANMYLLLKSLGSTRPQQTIARFESIPFVHEVAVTAINQRLAIAKKKDFISSSQDSRLARGRDEREEKLKRRNYDTDNGGG